MRDEAAVTHHLARLGFSAPSGADESTKIAAGVLDPAIGLLLSPMLAAAAMSFSSVPSSAMHYACTQRAFDLLEVGLVPASR